MKWLRGRDLNPRPLGYEPNELPDCSTPRHAEFEMLISEFGLSPVPTFRNLNFQIAVKSAIRNPHSEIHWWAWVESNYRPHAYQACALTN